MNVLQLFQLSGRKALVTGGGRGLGEQLAFALAEAGADVVLCSRKLHACEEVVEEIRQQTGVQALALELDVADVESIRQVHAEVEASFGSIDILVNNAGISWGAPPLEMPLDRWQQVMNVNATGTFLMTQAFAPAMIEQGYGRIVNISSVAGMLGTPPGVMDAVGYHASKGAVLAMTRELAVKWASSGVTVNAIAPGFFPTKMTAGVIHQASELMLSGTPMGRFGNEDDLKGLVVYLASAASAYMTGQVLVVDGGASAM